MIRSKIGSQRNPTEQMYKPEERFSVKFLFYFLSCIFMGFVLSKSYEIYNSNEALHEYFEHPVSEELSLPTPLPCLPALVLSQRMRMFAFFVIEMNGKY